MASQTTINTSNLIRSQIYTAELKEILQDQLMAMTYVNWLTDFPDGDQFIIPSIGQAVAYDYQENDRVQYRSLDTGQFPFTITEYVASAHSISKKTMQDSYLAERLMAEYVPAQERAILEHLEANVLDLQSKQTAGSTNLINGRKHRFVATGTSGVISLNDFAYANLALNVANVPAVGRVAIVSPETEYVINTLTNIVNVSNNPMWEGIVADGIATGMRFSKNIYGWDIWVSNRLSTITSETLESTNIAGYNACLFFSTAANPFVGAWRQQPEVEIKWDMDEQANKFLTTARYGVDLIRPESLVTIMTNPSAV